MSLGRHTKRQIGLFLAPEDIRSPGHPFYEKLNEILETGEFDAFCEKLCAPHYAKRMGRPSIPPGIYFRMLFVGYFEGLNAQRAIAWRCADSLALRTFLGLELGHRTPDHSSLSVIRRRLPVEVHQEVFRFVLSLLSEMGLLRGRTIAVDATTLEANAAMRSIVRRETGEDWDAYILRLAEEEGVEDPSDDDARRLDRKRKKRVSNRDWVSTTDPSAKITRMKDGRTHLAYKAEHAVDLETDAIVAVEVLPADVGDADSLVERIDQANRELRASGCDAEVEEAVADRGYHKAKTLADCKERGVRTYIPERQLQGHRRWKDKPSLWQQAFYGNRRRVRGRRGRMLQRLRSEYVERSFAHQCETGGMRRAWLCGIAENQKRYLAHAAARNLGLLMRHIFGVGTPRSLQRALGAAIERSERIPDLLYALASTLKCGTCEIVLLVADFWSDTRNQDRARITYSTGC